MSNPATITAPWTSANARPCIAAHHRRCGDCQWRSSIRS